MGQLVNVQTLIWLFPIMFIFHDFEELIMVEKWIKKHANTINKKLPKKIADRVMKQFSMSTAQFAVAVLVIFLFVSSSTYMASQYVNNGPLANIHFFAAVIIVFFIHSFTHIAQAIFFRSVTPGVITSVAIILPYTSVLFSSLFMNHVITWNTLLVSLPFSFLIIPIVLFAHWIGKNVV